MAEHVNFGGIFARLFSPHMYKSTYALINPYLPLHYIVIIGLHMPGYVRVNKISAKFKINTFP